MKTFIFHALKLDLIWWICVLYSKKFLPFIKFLNVFVQVTRLAQFALTSSCQRRIPENLAVGMAQLGPVMTFEFVGKVSWLKFLIYLLWKTDLWSYNLVQFLIAFITNRKRANFNVLFFLYFYTLLLWIRGSNRKKKPTTSDHNNKALIS